MSQQVNLFNPIFLKEKKHFSAKTMGQALLIILVFMVLLFGFDKYQNAKLSEEVAKVTAQRKQAEQQLASLKGYAARKKDPLLEEKVMHAQRDVQAMKKAFAYLRKDALGKQAGYSGYLKAFAHQIVQGVWLTGFSLEGAGSAIGLQGAALKPDLIPVYMNRLKREPVLQGKSFATFEISRARETGHASRDAGQSTAQTSSLSYVEFDLRAEGVEKTDAKMFSTSAATSRPSTGGVR